MNKFIFVLVVILAAFSALWYYLPAKPVESKMADFARCLRDKKAVMYGADWCPHCQNQKKMFGEAFKYVPYVECPKNPNECIAAGVNGYPTWILENGQKLVGEQALASLAGASGCALY